ncbi:MAG TPA: TrbG/VirB9 family P-type conjugative transfer protein [Thermoanaerobaculia bacterium]|nr:TrbG/VirB9 family P-type conjugative transfer protein [Thermoanaerobaculia bacterium]
MTRSVALLASALLIPACLLGQAPETPPASQTLPGSPAAAPPATLNCLPASPCDIELEASENVNEVVVAGGKDWSTQVVSTGLKPKTSHVIVWPDTSVTTGSTVIITTDRRLVSFGLSIDRTRAANLHTSLTSPEGNALRFKRELDSTPGGTYLGSIDPRTLNLDYSIPHGRNAPTVVFDDGNHTYIGWTDRKPSQAPVIFSVDEQGSNLLSPHIAPNGTLYVVDTVAKKIELKFGPKDNLTITNKAYDR